MLRNFTGGALSHGSSLTILLENSTFTDLWNVLLKCIFVLNKVITTHTQHDTRLFGYSN